MTSPQREHIERCIDDRHYRRAWQLLADLFQQQATAANAGFVISCFRRMQEHLPLTPRRVVLLRSFTIEPVVPFLQARSFLAGLNLEVQVGGFNTYAQELLDPASVAYTSKAHDVIVAVRTADVAPELWTRFADLSADEADSAVERTLSGFRSWVHRFRERSGGNVLLHTLEQPAFSATGLVDVGAECGQGAAIARINAGLRTLTRDLPGVYLVDYDRLQARHGRLLWHDEAKWLTMRMPVAAGCWIHLADEYMRFLRPLSGKIAKALVVDLDNTLWGGVVGEDGVHGLKLGAEYPGAAYQALQRVLLDLHRRGILLAICSKNNEADALAVLEKHPGMLLRPQHFAARRINWIDKARNLEDIATELNIGLDVLAFLDDSPAERELVRGQLPEVHVVDFPREPALLARTVQADPVFERLALSDEDRQRTLLYVGQQQRKELRDRAGSLEEYYQSLAMQAHVEPARPESIPRIAQLTQKTNQFNLTTRRYSEAEIGKLLEDGSHAVLSLRLVDRLGDNGLVGVGILCFEGSECHLDTFLLSCRVIGRTAETLFLRCLMVEAIQRGAVRMLGWFHPTAKNAPAGDFLAKHGFQPVRREGESVLWERALSLHELPNNPWIQCHYKEAA